MDVGDHARSLDHGQDTGTRAEERGVVLGHQLQGFLWAAKGGSAVVRDDGGAREEDTHGHVPHHPGGGHREIRDIGGTQPGVQTQGLEELECHTTVGVHDALGLAGGSG